ncbi:MAG TPA: cytochrome c maturation protein CcmE [Chitinophagaceae bacterium]|nr:cytochrome c maturation protein CcmE [Chitinophagaceae bacterium]
MKKSNIVLLVLIAVTIAVIISMVGDFSTYETFASAARQPGKDFHVIGMLDKTRSLVYDPVKDPNYFSFYVKDKAGELEKVVYRGAIPTDFEKSDKIVLVGKMDGQQFECSSILMKCPSKYKANRKAESQQLDSKL